MKGFRSSVEGRIMKKDSYLTKLKRSYNNKWKYVLILLPLIIAYVVVVYYPRLSIFPLSFYKWNPLSTAKKFVGWHNYQMMFSVELEDTLAYIGNTVVYVLGLLIIQTVVSMILALALQKNTKKNKFFRVFIFLPMVFSTTMVSLTWQFMYDPNLGVINNILGGLGVEGFPGKYLFENNTTAVLLIVIVHIWANMGYPLMMFTSGLNTIAEDYQEAARLDGASNWVIFRKITLPLMLPTILRISLMTIITGAMASDYIVMMGSMGSYMEYDTWAAVLYKKTLNSMDYGWVSAAAVMMFIIMAVLTVIQFLALRKVENSVLGGE